MDEKDLISTVTIKQVSEGGDAVRADLNASAEAQNKFAAASQNVAIVSEDSARRQTSAAAAFDSYTRRVDPASRALADFERAQGIVNRAFDQNPALLDRAGQGLDVYVSKLNAAAAAAENLRRQQSNLNTNPSAVTGSVNNTPISLNQITGSQLSNVDAKTYAAQFEAAAAAQDEMVAASTRLRAALDPLSVEQERVAAQLGVLKSALDAGKISQDVYANEQTKAGEALEAYATKLNAAATAAENLRRQQSNLSTNTVAPGPSNPTQITGAVLSNVDTKAYAAQFEAAAKAQDDQTASINRLRVAINPLEAEQGKLGAEMAQYKTLLSEGKITATEYAAAQEIAATRLSDFNRNLIQVGSGGRVAANELTNLSFQINDVVSGLALGQSPLRILAQQGGQIYQVFQTSKSSVADFGRAGVEWFTSLLTPMNAAIAGAVGLTAAAAALAAAWDKVQVSSQRAISGAGQRTGTSVADLNTFTSQNSSSFGLSSKEARTLGEDLTKTGDIVISKLHGMSDAVVGFANQAGVSMGDAEKAMVGFATDPIRALDELSKTYGSFDSTTRATVQSLVEAGNKTAAFQTIIDSLKDKSKAAADNMSLLEKAARGVVNVLAGEATKPSGLESQLEAARTKLNTAIEYAPAQGMPGAEEASKNIQELSKNFEDLQAAREKAIGGTAAAEFRKLSTDAESVGRSIIPEIGQLEQLRTKLAELEKAKAAGATSQLGGAVDNSALTAVQNLIAKTQEAQAAAARYNANVKEISASWGNVGQATALSLQASQNQLPVLEAVGGAARMAAQYTADYRNNMDGTKTAAEASALAAANLAAAQAQVNAAAKETLFNLQNQALAAGAVTGAEQMAAQAQATYVSLVHEGVSSLTAEAVAAQQLSNAQDAATAAVQKQVESLKDQNDMLAAQASGHEKSTAAAIAYKNAIQSGADATSASALAAETARTYTIRASEAALQWQQALFGVGQAAQSAADSIAAASIAEMNAADAAYRNNLAGTFNPDPANTISTGGGGALSNNAGFTSQQLIATLTPAATPTPWSQVLNRIADTAAQSGGLPAALSAVEGQQIYSTNTEGIQAQQSLVSQIVQAMNSSTTNKSTQVANLQQEMAWLQTQPVTLAREQQIANLQSSIDSLTKSTDSLNATNQDALSPYYNQDPRTSHIGFRSQGMSLSGSDYNPTVAGSPTGGTTSGTLAPAPAPTTNGNITINVPVTIVGARATDQNAIGRTVYQATQTAARQLQAAQR